VAWKLYGSVHEKIIAVAPRVFTSDLLAQASSADLGKGAVLFRQGDPVHHIIFVLEGELKAVRHLGDGSECVMVRARPGELFAESSLADNQYRCDGMAIVASRLALFPVEMFRSALGGADSLPYNLCITLARQARRQCSRQERLRLKRARDRVLHFLLCEGDRDGVVYWSSPLTELAAELGLERETLYRALAALEEEGLLQRANEQLRLLSKRD
jgi:CRP-like cAMP-binding protein